MTNSLIDKINFDKNQGLVPVIVQESESNEVLMLAYANRLAIEKTIKTGFGYYWSRTRNKLWKKGEESGNVQRVFEIKIDCDQDTLIYTVKQKGNACHNNTKTCFQKNLL